MKVLKVIHGYPPRYSAGSEVYSQILAQGLAHNHEVQVFTRQENSFINDFTYTTELDISDPRILVHLVNVPRAKYSDTFSHLKVESLFQQILVNFKPDIVHFGHLNHLSLKLPKIAYQNNIPSIFTLHDFWLMCPRGQFLQRNSNTPWELCDGQDDDKCAQKCYIGKFSGTEETFNGEREYWKKWISHRMELARSVIEYSDILIAPSKFLQNKFANEFNVPSEKSIYLDYGFDLNRLKGRKKEKGAGVVFGYIGTHTPQKGIHLLIKAFAKLNSDAKLKIWGYLREDTPALKALVTELPAYIQQRIEWRGGYVNENIVEEVFNKVDAIIVPSIWGENSPLVIHEAQQVRVPVITADYGGMSEYVRHMSNGLLFKHRDIDDLVQKMQMVIDNPSLLLKLASKGYLYSESSNIPSINDHVYEIEGIYKRVIEARNKPLHSKPGPWRITFDTNPDHCNYQCIMCECFSPYSKVKEERVKNGESKKVMSIETIRKVLEESKDTPLKEIIPSTMGEPLLYKDFDKIIQMCYEFNLKLNLTTNGSFPIKGVDEWAVLLVPILSDIKISWNGATKETHEKIMVGSNWEKVCKNLKKFLAVRDSYSRHNNHRCTVTLQLTFLETNLNELQSLINMAIELGIDRVKGHHLWAHFEEIKGLSMRREKNSIKRWNNTVKELYKLRDNKLLPNGKKITLENFEVLNEDATEDLAPGGPCPFLSKEAWINTEGEFSPCCAPNELRKGLGSFGDVNTKSLQDIWQSQEYRELQKSYLTHNLCLNCNMRKPLIKEASL
jgi:glycosyltransferase involved in cell wall biosynthesis/MoaA/NifB/PqqE/SkfB family radical SAM enzyme